jgi:uncharacterized membrane protein
MVLNNTVTDAGDDGRGESPLQKLDRNWLEMLQELRVLQTGIQILTGFLLTLPFQARFTELDGLQLDVYLALVVLSALITALLLSIVTMHRLFFGLHIRESLVRNADRIFRFTMLLVGLVLMGTTGLIFDLVLGRTAGTAAALALGAVILLLWAIIPLAIRRRALRADRAAAHHSTGPD